MALLWFDGAVLLTLSILLTGMYFYMCQVILKSLRTQGLVQETTPKTGSYEMYRDTKNGRMVFKPRTKTGPVSPRPNRPAQENPVGEMELDEEYELFAGSTLGTTSGRGRIGDAITS